MMLQPIRFFSKLAVRNRLVTRLSVWIHCALLAAICAATNVSAEEPKKITYDDHIKPIFREHCTSCHNANDKKSGLSLESYQAVLAGGSSGEIVIAGDTDSSRLFSLTAHKEQPFMPPNQDKIAQSKLDLLKTWIDQGMPENSGSAMKKSMASSSALGIASTGRPEGAPPMPNTMLKQTPFYTPRAAAISALAASPWSPLIAVGGQMQVSLYHSESGELLGILPFPEGEPQSITFSRDGKLILIGGGKHSSSGFAVLHEIESGKRIARVGDELDIVFAADISEDNQLIALAGPQKMVRVYETLTGKLKYEQKKHTDWIYAVRFSPDGLLLATADRSSGLVVWEAHSGRLFADLPGHKGEIRSLGWRPDSQALISSSLDGTLKLWDMHEGKLIKSWDAHPGGAMAIAVCNDGTMASTGKDQKVKLWDGAGNAAGEMPALVDAGYEVAITVDAKQIAAGDWQGNVRLWQRANPKEERVISANPMPLEKQIADTRQALEKANLALSSDQQEFDKAKAQLETIQKDQTALQTQLQNVVNQLQEVTEQSKQQKSMFADSKAKLEALQTEINGLKAKDKSKRELVSVLSRSQKALSDSVQSLQQLRNKDGADIATIDLQIQAQKPIADAQSQSLAALESELQSMATNLASHAQSAAALQQLCTTLNNSTAQLESKVVSITTERAMLEKKSEALASDLKQKMEFLRTTQSKFESSQQTVSSLQSRVEQLTKDFDRFNSYLSTLAEQKRLIDQSLAASMELQKPIEVQRSVAKDQLANIDSEIAKLQQQLTLIQAKIAEEQNKRTQVNSVVQEKQKELDTIRSKLEQSESELGSIALQQQLFEQAFGKK